MTTEITKTLKARSIELSKATKEIGVEIHKHLCSLMLHTLAHRDVSLFTHFVTLLENKHGDASHSIVRVNAVKAWVGTFGPARFGKLKDGKPGFLLKSDRLDEIKASPETEKEHIQLAKASPFNRFMPEKPLPTFDIDKAIKALIDRAVVASKNKNDEGKPIYSKVSVPAERLDALKALIV